MSATRVKVKKSLGPNSRICHVFGEIDRKSCNMSYFPAAKFQNRTCAFNNWIV